MKSKFLPFLFCLSIGIHVFAQPTIDGVNPSFGDIFQLGVLETAPDPGSAGENITWDFSNLNNGSLFEYEILDPDESPGNELFPNANFATSVSNVEILEPLYFFYQIDNSQWSDWGSYTSMDEFTIAVVMDNPQTAYNFPITYGSVGSDMYSGEVQGFFNSDFTGSSEYTADGYGELILPDGTYSNVLRLSMTRTQENEPIAGQSLSSVSTIHAWISAEIPFPLLIIDETENFFNGEPDGVEASTTYLINYDGSPMSVTDKVGAFSVLPYPNPSSGLFQFNLDPENQIAELYVYNILGERVDLNPNLYSAQSIDLSGCTPGIYLLQFEFTNGMSSSLRVQVVE